eukprot:jgi/Mesvir1/14340/Mv09748-RA.1
MATTTVASILPGSRIAFMSEIDHDTFRSCGVRPRAGASCLRKVHQSSAPYRAALSSDGHAGEKSPQKVRWTPSRREAVGAGLLSIALVPCSTAHAKQEAGDWSTPGLNSRPEDEYGPRFLTLAGGIKVQDLSEGQGEPAQSGGGVLFDFVLRRSNGYFIYSTIDGVSFQPRDVPTGPLFAKLGGGTLIPGLEEVLIGMKPGARRRALIPPSMGYIQPNLQPQMPTFGTRRQLESHSSEPLLFEVQMLRTSPPVAK